MPQKRETELVLTEKGLMRVFFLTTLLVFALFSLRQFAGIVAAPLVFVLLAMILVMALNPILVRLESRYKVPRKFGAPMLVLGILAALVGFIAVVVPLFTAQAMRFIKTLPEVIQNFQASVSEWVGNFPMLEPLFQGEANFNIDKILNNSGLVNGVVGVAGNVAGLAASAVLLFILVLFLLMNPEPVVKGVLSGIPPRNRETVERTLIRIGSQLGTWLLGVLVVSVVVGVLVWLGLTLLGFDNALLFGMIAGVSNLIPFVGPWLGILLPILVAISHGAWMMAIGAAAVMFVVQQVESYFISPAIFGRTIQLHPASMLIGALIFGSWLGLVGVFLAVPLAIIIKALYEEVYLASLRRPEASDESVAQVVAAGHTEEPLLEQLAPAESQSEAAQVEKAVELTKVELAQSNLIPKVG